MRQDLKFEGIYDLRTLKLLKSKGIKDFGFNFSPKSFNFIQEYILLEKLAPLLGPDDKIHLHFLQDSDPMIEKVISDLLKVGFNKKNIFLYCDEWNASPAIFEVKYFLNYHIQLPAEYLENNYFAGVVFEFSFFEKLYTQGMLSNFITNYYMRFEKILGKEIKAILKVDWNSNIMPSLFDYFEFDLISLPIDSNLEICYRNVDLKKLADEMALFEKNKIADTTF